MKWLSMLTVILFCTGCDSNIPSSNEEPIFSIRLQENRPGLCRVDGIWAESKSSGFTGDGYANVEDTIGSRIVWSVNAQQAGQYNLAIRFALDANMASSAELFVNAGSGVSHQLSFPVTGSNWQTLSLSVTLQAGQNTLALVSTSNQGFANVDSLTVTGPNIITAAGCDGLQSSISNFTAKDGLFDNKDANTLGLTYPSEIFNTVAYNGLEGISQYNHGAVLFPFKGQLYLQWQSSQKDEDGADTVVRFTTSNNGESWADDKVLVKARDGFTLTNGGWWSNGETLVAYINVWPENLKPRGGYVEYIISNDGVNWSQPKRVLQADGQFLDGVIEQDIRALPNGRLLTAVHKQPGLIATPYYTDDPSGITGWQAGNFTNLSHSGSVSHELEPSWYLKADGSVTMTFRDQSSSHTILAATSLDNGVNWTQVKATNMPDSRAKQSAGNLPNGTAFIVNNPTGTKARLPLTVTLSTYGNLFDKAYLLIGGEVLPTMRYQGKYKRIGYSYPKSLVWQGYLWSSYGINKEDIGITRVPVESISL